jgi:hypothetical protein
MSIQEQINKEITTLQENVKKLKGKSLIDQNLLHDILEALTDINMDIAEELDEAENINLDSED